MVQQVPALLRQHWAALAQGMQHDVQAYAQLQTLLQSQFHAALRHDAKAMEVVAQQISAQAQQLAQSSADRSQHMQALLPAGQVLSMSAVLALLQGGLRHQMQALWRKLEQQVQDCQRANLRNCALIMEQADIMRQVLAGGVRMDEGIYGPR